MARTAFIDHIGFGVPDLAAAKKYYDELMPVLGLRQWFPTAPEAPSSSAPTARKAHSCPSTKLSNIGRYSRHRTGLQHISFMVASRDIVRECTSGQSNGPRSFTSRANSPSTVRASTQRSG